MKFKFSFDNRLKQNYFSTNYFLKTIKIIENKNNIVSMQFIHFSNSSIMVCGIEEVIQLLKFCLEDNFNKIKILAHNDGDIIDSNEPILVIIGNYKYFGHLENIIDGILASRCSVATNTYNMKKYLKDSQSIIYMADRLNSYFNQPFDAYPAYIGGIKLFTSDAQIEFFKDDKDVNVIGTMPHALIQQNEGNLHKAIEDYYLVHKSKPIALIDYHNNVIEELEKIKDILDKIDGVRIDTSKINIDESLLKLNKKNYGVNHQLVCLVRDWLDNNGGKKLKIIVSSGINLEDMKNFYNNNTPIDMYGIGGYFLLNSVHISADLVELNYNLESKFGREKKSWKNLKKIVN